MGSPRPRRVVPSEVVAQTVEPLLWQFADMLFGLVDRQVELVHKPSHLVHRLFGAAFATDHEVIGICA